MSDQSETKTASGRLWPAEVERILAWRSDDFGHDTHALLVAESSALQRVGEDWLRLEAENQRLRDLVGDGIQLLTYVTYDGSDHDWIVRAQQALKATSHE